MKVILWMVLGKFGYVVTKEADRIIPVCDEWVDYCCMELLQAKNQDS